MKEKELKASNLEDKKDKNTRKKLFKKAKELKIPNYQKLKNDDLEKEILKFENTSNNIKDNISLLSRAELIEIAKNLKIKNYSKLKKDKLIEEIKKLKDEEKNINIIDNKPNEELFLKEIPNNLEVLNKTELIELCKLYKVKNYSKINKNRIIKLLIEIRDNKKTEPKKDIIVIEDNKEKAIELIQDNTDNKKTESKKDIIVIEDNKEKTIELIQDNTDNKKTEPKKDIIVIEDNKEKAIELIQDNTDNKKTESIDKSDISTKIKKDEEKKEENILINDKRDLKEIKKKELEIKKKAKNDAKKIQDDIKTKILFMPSKYTFGKTNEEYLFEDEKNIDIKFDILDKKTEITLMPIDPYKSYIYWTLSTEDIKTINKLKIKELILKLNDVTGVIYNGKNANSFWFEKCLINSPNWYINMPKNNFNLCIELGYLIGNKFFILTQSNVVHIPTSSPSQIINDEFVLVDYTREENKVEEKNIVKTIIPRPNKSIRNRKIPKYFIKEYDIQKEKPIIKIEEDKKNIIIQDKLSEIKYLNIDKDFKKENNNKFIYRQENNKNISNIPIENKNRFIYRQENNKNISNIPKYEKNIEKEDKKENIYYTIPGNKKIRKIFNIENRFIPYKKIFYYLEPNTKIHEKIYRISYGPYFIKKFIGASEKIKFIGSSDIYLGASENFIGSSDIYLGASENFIGSSDIYLGASENFIGSSDNNTSKRNIKEKYYRFTQPIELDII